MKAVVVGQPPAGLARLRELGVTLIEAGDGIDGIRKILAWNPDFALVGVDLPHLNGVNLAKILHLLRIPTPLVFTAAGEERRARALAFPRCAGYFTHGAFPQEFGPETLARIEGQSVPLESEEKLFGLRMDGHDWMNILSSPGRRRILVVDDSPVIKRFLTLMLEQSDRYEIYTADDGLEGLHKAVMVSPDLIISDIGMPTLDGLSMSQILYILGKPYPIVFHTARDNDELLARARKLDGVIGYLVKGRLRQVAEFQREIENLLKIAHTLQETSAQVYRKGSLDLLAQTGSDRGVLWDGAGTG